MYIVNLKCGYSTFEALVDRKILRRRYINYEKAKDVYFITRDPYKRLESFYREKFIKSPISLDQYWLQEMIKYIPYQRILDRNVTFEEFIKTLARGYGDDHITPQYYAMNRIVKKHHNVHFVKLERGLSQLAPIIGVNPDDYMCNVSKDTTANIEWTREMRNIVNLMYARDFVILGYSMLI